jgi:glycosyltransferase involved in cell wall biosynthesis
MSDYPLHVGYDAHAFVAADKGTGKGRQLRNILGDKLKQFVGFAPPGAEVSGLPLIRGGPSKYLVWQQTELPRMIRRAKLDVFLAPYNTAPLILPRRTKLVLVLHDLIPLERLPGASLRLRILLSIWRFLIPRAVARAHVILTVSEYSRQQILKRFPSARVSVIPCTIADSWFEAQTDVAGCERGDYLFLITTIEPHRNLDRALQAYANYVAAVGRDAFQLRIAGVWRRSEMVREKVQRLKLDDHVVIEPYLSDADMQDRVRRARAIYMPSLVEGFGIPVLEGMSSGTPILCSNVTSLPEVGADAPEYFDPLDVDSMTAALMNVLCDESRQAAMAHAGIQRAKSFHPRLIARCADDFWTGLAGELGQS